MKLLLQYLGRFRKLIILALLMAAVSQVFSFLNPYILANALIDPFASKAAYFRTHGLDQEFFRGIITGVLLIAGASTVSWVAKGYQDYLVNTVIQKLGASLYVDVQRHVLCLPFQDFEDQRSGEVLSVLQRVRADCEKFITRFVNVLFATLIGVVVVTLIAIQLSPWLPVIYLAGAALLSVATHAFSKRVKSIQQGIVEESTALAGSTTESLRNIELVKSLGLTRQEIQRLTQVTWGILDRELKKLVSFRSVSFVYYGFAHALHQGVMFLLLVFVFYDQMTVGQLLMMQLYFYFIFGPLPELGGVIVAYREAEASLNTLRGLLSKPVEQRPRTPRQIGSIASLRFEGVHFRHRSAARLALQDVSFRVQRGETVAVVGPSGSGKTTLVKLLVGLYAPTAGHIYYNDHCGGEIDFDELRHQIGLVTQDTQLFSGTIRENLLFVNPRATDEMMEDALRKAACQALLGRADQRLHTRIGEGGLKLSGGERQRLSIARSLLRESRLLIFDEATSSLDSITEAGIATTIRQITRQHQYITLLIAHRLSTVMFADRIYVLERGQIIETGTHTSLLKEKGLYYAMWRQQIGEWQEALPADLAAPSPAPQVFTQP